MNFKIGDCVKIHLVRTLGKPENDTFYYGIVENDKFVRLKHIKSFAVKSIYKIGDEFHLRHCEEMNCIKKAGKFYIERIPEKELLARMI